jgi:hypothetical protein
MSSSRSFDFNNLSTLGTLIFIDVGDISKDESSEQESTE